jgi:glutathione S-transferase
MTQSSRFTLYSGPLSMFGAKVQIAAREKGLEFDLVMVPFDFQKLYVPRHPEVERINPKRQVPVLVHGSVEIFDSTQIFEYLEDLSPATPLWPRDIAARAKARLLEHKADEVYFPHIIKLMGYQGKLDDPTAVAAIEGAMGYYAQMEALLAEREYLAGDYSFADIAFYMAALFGQRLGAPFAETVPRLSAWREKLTQRPAVRQVVGPMVAYLVSQNRPIPRFLQEFVPRG